MRCISEAFHPSGFSGDVPFGGSSFGPARRAADLLFIHGGVFNMSCYRHSNVILGYTILPSLAGSDIYHTSLRPRGS